MKMKTIPRRGTLLAITGAAIIGAAIPGALALGLVFSACENPVAGPVMEEPVIEEPVIEEPVPEDPVPDTHPDAAFWDALTGWQTFDSLAALGAFLASAPDNTALTPYAIKLSGQMDVADFSKGTAVGNDKLGFLFDAFHGKYVALDLFACTGTAIANNTADTTTARTDPDKLVGIILPASLQTLGDYLFYDDITEGPASSLTTVIFPRGLSGVGKYAFHGAALRAISLPASLINLGEGLNSAVFKNCTHLAAVYAPDGLPRLTTISKECFMNTALASFPFPAALTFIGAGAFEHTRFVSLSIPACGNIRGRAFADSALLEEATLPDGLTSLDLSAFNDCPALERLNLPGTIRASSMVNYPLWGSPHVTFTVAAGTTIVETYADGKALVSTNYMGKFLFTAPALAGNQTLNGLYEVMPVAFINNTAITGLVFGAGVTTIGSRAFGGCTSLASVDLPATITTLAADAFIDAINGASGGAALVSLTIRRADWVVGAGITGTFTPGFKVYVPAAMVSAYQEAPGWADFSIQAIP
jgi:hypothetical protein